MEKKILFENIWVRFYMLKHSCWSIAEACWSIRAPGCRLPLETIISPIFSIIIIRKLCVMHYAVAVAVCSKETTINALRKIVFWHKFSPFWHRFFETQISPFLPKLLKSILFDTSRQKSVFERRESM